MNRTLITAILVLTLAAPALATGADSVEQYIPADAQLVVAVKDLPGTYQRWSTSPLARLWDDPSVREFLAPLHDQMAEESIDEAVLEETGYTVAELLELFPGGMAMFVPDLVALAEAEGPDLFEAGAGFVAMASGGSRIDDLEALILELEDRETDDPEYSESFVDTTQDYRDIVLHIEQRIDLEEPRDEISWAVVEDVLAVASDPDTLRTAIDGILDGPASGRLLDSSDPAMREVGSDDLWAYIDLAPLIPMMESSLTEDLAENNPSGIDPDALMDAIGFRAMRTAFVGIGMEGDTTRVSMGATMAENVGLFRLLAFENRPLRQVPGIPADAANFSVTHFDFQEAWQSLEDGFNQVNPMFLAMAAGQFNGWQEAQGLQLDLRRDLLENLGTRIVGIQLAPEGSIDSIADPNLEDQVVILAIEDRQGLEGLIESVKSSVSQGGELFETREFMDVAIHTVKAASPDATTPRVSYAITDESLYVSVGQGRALEGALIARARPDAPSAWDQPDVRRAVATVSGDVASFSYQATDVWLEMVFNLVAFLGATSEDDEMVFDTDAIPPREVVREYLGPMVSVLTKSQSEILVRSWIMPAAGDDS